MTFGINGRYSNWSLFRWLTSTMIVDCNFGTSVRCSSGCRSVRRQLAMTQWPLFSLFFIPHVFILQKLTGAPKNLEIQFFPDPFGYFVAPQQPFWIFEELLKNLKKSGGTSTASHRFKVGKVSLGSEGLRDSKNYEINRRVLRRWSSHNIKNKTWSSVSIPVSKGGGCPK